MNRTLENNKVPSTSFLFFPNLFYQTSCKCHSSMDGHGLRYCRRMFNQVVSVWIIMCWQDDIFFRKGVSKHSNSPSKSGWWFDVIADWFHVSSTTLCTRFVLKLDLVCCHVLLVPFFVCWWQIFNRVMFLFFSCLDNYSAMVIIVWFLFQIFGVLDVSTVMVLCTCSWLSTEKWGLRTWWGFLDALLLMQLLVDAIRDTS